MRQQKSCTTCEGRGYQSHALDACKLCSGTGVLQQKCGQCWRWKPVTMFLGALKSGKRLVRANCHECIQKYKNWEKLSPVERELLSDSRKGLSADGPLRVFFTLKSGNQKTGEIPVSMTSASSCPPSCSYFGAGCYAERHVLGAHWRRLSAGAGRSWREFCDMVRALPAGQLWRHNEAGDLPGLGEQLDESAIVMLAGAAQHTRGFTYTHKLGRGMRFLDQEAHFQRLRYLNGHGLTVNLSVDNYLELDEYAQWDLPLTTVLPLGHERVTHTKRGLKVLVCPAQLTDTNCKSCGICQAKDRKAAVGFLAHGMAKGQITDRLAPRRQLPLFEEAAR